MYVMFQLRPFTVHNVFPCFYGPNKVIIIKAFTSSSRKQYEPHLITSKNNDELTFITGGVTLNNCELSVKSFSLSVADMMINLSGFPFCEQKIHRKPRIKYFVII